MSLVPLLLFLAAIAWTSALFAAPLVAPSAAAEGIWTAAGTVCHQLADRSFHLGGGPVAVCARCLGLYAGSVGGFGAALLARGARPREGGDAPRQARLLVAALAVPTLITLAVEHVVALPVGNLARFATAAPLGGAIAWVIARAIAADLRSPVATEVD